VFGLLAGTFVTIVGFFIDNRAVPPLQVELHVGSDAVQFVIAGYALALASGLLTAGRLGDLQGRMRLVAIGIATFSVASAACGAAPTAGTLVAARVVLGFAAAALTPQVLAILGMVCVGAARVPAPSAPTALPLGLRRSLRRQPGTSAQMRPQAGGEVLSVGALRFATEVPHTARHLFIICWVTSLQMLNHISSFARLEQVSEITQRENRSEKASPEGLAMHS
jgi:MFS family permease